MRIEFGNLFGILKLQAYGNQPKHYLAQDNALRLLRSAAAKGAKRTLELLYYTILYYTMLYYAIRYDTILE